MPKSLTSTMSKRPGRDTGIENHDGTTAAGGSASDFHDWELAEIKRSAVEAQYSHGASLLASQANIAKYMDPPADALLPLEYAFHLLGEARGKAVLEYGCGSGENTIVLAHRGADVQAIDISPDLIGVADRRMQVNGKPGAVRFDVASAYAVPCADESVDILFGISILHHLDLAEAAREVYRVLKRGGRAIFSEPVRNSPTLRVLRKLIPYRAPDVSPFERPLTFQELDAFSAHFHRGRARSFQLPWLRAAVYLPVLRGRLPALYRVDAAMLAKYPRLDYYAAVRVFELQKP
jgi:SAM-dependent methyltransferase